MPIFTGTIFAWSPSITNTTSICLTASFDFLSDLATLVPSVAGAFVPAESALVVAAERLDFAAAALVPAFGELVPGGSARAASFASGFFSFSFGGRVVTLANGTVSALVRYAVSISAVTDMPGRNASFSWMRILTLSLIHI